VLVLLAVPSVLKMMDGAKTNAFQIEAENIAKAAKAAYADDLLDDDTTRSVTGGYCYSISYLQTNGYVDKTFGTSHHGSVLVGSSSTTVWYIDGSHSITGGTAGDLSADETLQTTITNFDTCNIA
ncbi:MAG TPA: hypothetical protein PLX66_03585, partial [Bacilli bacterium]|nr:hypothetical protein [Bacilli bacterium]